MKVADLSVDMSVNVARLVQGMNEAKRTVKESVEGIEKLLGLIGVGFSAKELIEKVHSVSEAMSKLGDEASKIGGTVEKLSKLQFFADASGSNIDGVTSALVKLSKGMAEAGNASAPTSQALKFLGLSAKDAAGNLKDPSDLVGEIAKKLATYQDGAGKAAIAQALFGKSGADILPTLKKLVEVGEIEATTTTEQAQAADIYGVAIAKLNQQKQMLWNTLVGSILPQMTNFVEVLTEAGKRTDSLGASLKSLTSDGSVNAWAEAAIMGASRFVDVLLLIPKTLDVIFSSFKAAIADLEVLPKHIAIIASFLTPGGLTKAEGDAAYKELLDEQVRLTREANQKMADLYNSDKTAFSRAMEQKIADARAMQANAGRGGDPRDNPKSQLNFKLIDQKLAAAELKLYEGAVKSLEDQLGKLNNQTASQKLAFELYGKEFETADGATVHLTGSLEKLSQAHKDMLPFIAAEIDKRTALNDLLKSQTESAIGLEQALVAQQNIRSASRQNDSDLLDDMKFQFDLIGKTIVEQGRLNAVRQVDLKLQSDLRAASKAADESDPLLQTDAYRKTVADLNAGAAAQKEAVLAGLAERTRAERDWVTGAQGAFNDYIDHATNAANLTRDAFTAAFRGMEDMMFNFFRHGKLGVSDFVGMIKDALARLAAQQFTLNIVGNVGGALGMTGSGGASGGGGMMGMFSNLATAKSLGGMFGGGSGAGAVGSIGAGGMVTTAAPVFDVVPSSFMLDAGAAAAGEMGSAGLVATGGTVEGLAAAGTSASLASGAGITAALGAIPVWGWAALGAMALLSMSGSDNHNADPKGPPNIFNTAIRAGQAGLHYSWQGERVDGGQYSGGTDLGAGDVSGFNNQVAQMLAAMRQTGIAAGFTADQFDKLVLDADSTGSSLQESFQNTMASLGGSIATQLIPNIKDFQVGAESLTDTFSRLTQEMATVNGILSLFGQGKLGSDQLGSVNSLVTGAGGTGALQSKADAFFQAFFSPGEQASMTRRVNQQSVADAFGGLGLGVPGSRGGFRNLVLGADLTTEAGRNLYNTLLNIAPAFDALNKSMQAANDTLFSTLADFRLYNARAAAGISQRIPGGFRHFASGGAFGGGWRIVGENGPEAEYTGPSQIMSNAVTSSLMDMGAVVSELQQLRAENQAHAIALVRATQAIERQMHRWEGDGMPIRSDDDNPVVTREAA